MKLDRLVEMLAEELKLAAIPQKDKDGLYQLKIGNSPQVAAKELEPGVFLHATVTPLPKEGNKEALFIHLMKANLLGRGAGGAAIGLDDKEKQITLSLTLPFEVSYKIFHESLEDFLNYIDFWKEEVERFQKTLF